jgi:hypothetical protein
LDRGSEGGGIEGKGGEEERKERGREGNSEMGEERKEEEG